MVEDSRVVICLVESGVATRYWESAVPLLSELGWEAVFASVFPAGKAHAYLEKTGILTVSLGAAGAFDYWSASRRLAALAISTGATLIHASEPIPALVAVLARLHRCRAGVIFHYQSERPSTLRIWAFTVVAAWGATLTMAVSAASARAVRRLTGLPARRVVWAWSGVPDIRAVTHDELEELRQMLGISRDAAVVVHVARLRREKGQPLAVEAVNRVSTAGRVGRRVELVLVGDGPDRHLLRDLASRSRVPIHLVGHQADVAPWLRLGDVIVMPSEREGFGLAATEAMAAARAVVASATGGLCEIVVSGNTGLLVDPGDAQQLAGAIEQFLADPSRAEQTGRAARARYLALFSAQRMVKGWMRAYTLALERQGQGAQCTVITSGEAVPYAHRAARYLARRGTRGMRFYWGLADKVRKSPPVAIVPLRGAASIVLPTDEWMARQTYRGAGDRAEFAIIEALLRPGNVAVDVGANFGVYSVVLADIVGPHGYVAAFEPSPRVLASLRANLQPFPSVTIFEYALSDQPGVGTLHGVDDQRHSGLASLHDHDHSGGAVTRVRVAQARDVLVNEVWQHIDFLKIDVEGHEPEVLRGFRPWLAGKRIAAMQIEVTPQWGGSAVFDEVERSAPGAYAAFLVSERGRVRLRPTLIHIRASAEVDHQANVLFLLRERAAELADRFDIRSR